MSVNLFITVVFCIVIVCIGVYVWRGLCSNGKKLDEIYRKFDEQIIKRENDYSENVGEADVVASDYRRITYDKGKLYENRDKYYVIYADYVALSQMISIFPLLGIMGTVLGLVMNTTSDVEQLVSGLGMALWTTLAGLVFSIFLKWKDANDLGKNFFIK